MMESQHNQNLNITEAFCSEAVKKDVEAKEFVPEALKAAVETATEETPDAGEDDCGPRP